MDISDSCFVMNCVASTPQYHGTFAPKTCREVSKDPKSEHRDIVPDGEEERMVTSNYFKSADWYGSGGSLI